VGGSGDRSDVSGMESIIGAAVSKGYSWMAHFRKDGPCDEGGNGSGVHSVSDGAGGGVSGCGHRAGEEGVLWRGERRFSSPPSLSSSASHCLLIAFFVCLAGGGEGSSEEPGKCLGSEGSGSEGSAMRAWAARAWAVRACAAGLGRQGLGSECLGTDGLGSKNSKRGDGDFARVGVGALRAAEEGAGITMALASLVMVVMPWRRCQRQQRWTSGAVMMIGDQ
jgi:hypothetical protein